MGLGEVFCVPHTKEKSLCEILSVCDTLYCFVASHFAMPFPRELILLLVGAILSEPHSNVTALRKCVCMLACLLASLRPYTVNLNERMNERPSPTDPRLDSFVPSTGKDYC